MNVGNLLLELVSKIDPYYPGNHRASHEANSASGAKLVMKLLLGWFVISFYRDVAAGCCGSSPSAGRATKKDEAAFVRKRSRTREELDR